MYDYYLGPTPDAVTQDEEKFLLSIKQLLPKWLNGIPDCELIATTRLMDEAAERAKARGDVPFFCETGVGASTIGMVWCAVKHGARAYTWDPNSEKAEQVRTVCFETIGFHTDRNINQHWNLIASDSVSPHLGLPVLPDLTDHVDYFLHDGDHVWNTISKELEAVTPLLRDGSVVAVDDAQYAYVHTNEYIVDVMRTKAGLGPADYGDNRCDPFHAQVHDWLAERFESVEDVAGYFRENFRNDMYYAYYTADREVRAQTVSKAELEQDHRFVAWRVSGAHTR